MFSISQIELNFISKFGLKYVFWQPSERTYMVKKRVKFFYFVCKMFLDKKFENIQY